MRTVIETPTFQKQAARLWSEDERLGFISWLAFHPDAGTVIPGADGARKVRWGHGERGKSGGARVIYFHHGERGELLVVMLYVKAEHENVAAKAIQRAM